MAKSQSARNVFRGLLHTREPEVGMQVGIRDEEMDVSLTQAGWEPGGGGGRERLPLAVPLFKEH